MVTQAAKELFTLLNALCGGLLLVGLAVYLLRARPRRASFILFLLLLTLVCALNAIIIYALL